ncbi:hypothetical protein [Stenotrophomonas oahuensis]|uniref:Transmembrane protein n=1 Tax=Stenotrophomonas oahuensis TaxID=3003271 RepID=A0ABY9YSM6_9GAMM|nr:hypothetical protein [Stenotrophomonas sp. A5586]WNH53936.1 hypothetical protein PDM29_06535 [Stenotrophomonas sp. A5586]
MNKGIPYLLAVLVALTLSAGWAAPVLALFEHVASCLGSGGSVDLVGLRCVPGAPMALGWSFWATSAATTLVVMAVTNRRGLHRR